MQKGCKLLRGVDNVICFEEEQNQDNSQCHVSRKVIDVQSVQALEGICPEKKKLPAIGRYDQRYQDASFERVGSIRVHETIHERYRTEWIRFVKIFELFFLF